MSIVSVDINSYFFPVVVVLKDNEFAVVLIRLIPAVHNLVTPLLHAHTLAKAES